MSNDFVAWEQHGKALSQEHRLRQFASQESLPKKRHSVISRKHNRLSEPHFTPLASAWLNCNGVRAEGCQRFLNNLSLLRRDFKD